MRRILIALGCLLLVGATPFSSDDNRLSLLQHKILETEPTLWLDASDTGSITFDASANVQYWYSKIGTYYVKQTATAAQRPAYTNFINGRHVITCDGGDVLTSNVGQSSILSSTALTIIGVFNLTDSTATQDIIVNSGDAGRVRAVVYTNTFQVNLKDAGGWQSITTSISPGLYIWRHRLKNGKQTLKLSNGGSGSKTTGDADMLANINICSQTGSNGFTGDLAEIIFWNKALTYPQVINTYEYLSRKWGISADFEK